MIVDGEPEILRTVKTFLTDVEFDVVVVKNSREGLDFLEEKNNENVDLILVNTPVPGTETTGFFSMKPHSTEQTADTGAFLQKPFTREQLLEFIKKGI